MEYIVKQWTIILEIVDAIEEIVEGILETVEI